MPTSIARRNIHTAKSPRLRLPRIARDNGIGLGVTTRCGRNRFRSDSNGNDDDDDWGAGHCFQGRSSHDVDDDLDLGLEQVSRFG